MDSYYRQRQPIWVDYQDIFFEEGTLSTESNVDKLTTLPKGS